MGRRPNDSEPTIWVSLVLLLMGLGSCSVVYMFMSVVLRPTTNSSVLMSLAVDEGENGGGCCRGIENLELWGAAVKWGSDFKFSSSEECCQACKNLCTGNDGPCLCDSWVFCGNPEACGPKFGECWLKKQKDTLAPERQESGNSVSWMSGLVYGKGEGIVGLETEYGMLHIELITSFSYWSYPLCEVPLLSCRKSWTILGFRREPHKRCPPFALVQGTLEAQGTIFNKIPKEDCPIIRRGSVAWVGSGPEFFFSLANHEEWRKAYTVFGSVLPEDMVIVGKIAELPTKSDVWNNINVSASEKPIPFWFQRIQTSNGNLNLNDNAVAS